MAETTKIDERQSATWAQELTLKALLAESASSNSILESFLKVSGKLSDAQIAEMEKSRLEAKKNSDDASKSLGKVKPNIDMSLKDAFGDLRVSLRESVDTIKSGFKSGDVSSVMSGLSSQAKNAGTSMMEWGKAQPAAMRSLSMFAGGLTLYAGVAMAMWGTMTQLNAEFGKMYETGINFTGGLQGMATAAGNMGISTSELSSTFTQFGAAVTYLGVDRAAKLGSEFSKLNRETGTLGMTNQQAVEAMLEYSEMMRSTGLLSKMSNDEITKGAKEYYTELNQIAAVTGRNRKEIEKSISAQAKNLDFQVVLRSLPTKVQENVLKSARSFEKFGKEGSEALTKTMTSFLAGRGLAGLDKGLQMAFSNAGLESTLQSMSEKMKNGGDVGDEMNIIAEKMRDPKLFDTFKQFAGMPGVGGDLIRTIQGINSSNENYYQSEKKLIEAAEIEAGTKEHNAAYDAAYLRLKQKRDNEAEAKNAANRRAEDAMTAATQTLSNLFKTLAVNVLEPMLPVIRFFAATIEVASSVIGGIVSVIASFGSAIESIVSFITKWTIKIGSLGMIGNETAEAGGGALGSVAGTVATAGAGYAAYKGATAIGGRVGKIFGFGKEAAGTPPGAPKASSPIEESMDKLGDTKKTLGAKMADMTSSIKDMAGNLTGAVKDAMANLSKAVGDTLSNLSKGLGDSLSNLSRGLGDAIANVSNGLGKALGSLGAGVGEAIAKIGTGLGAGLGGLIEGVLRGLGAGLSAMANPAILIGAGILSGSILVIGGAIAGATWIMGKALPTMAEGLKAFGEIDGSNLISVGGGMIAIGAGLAAMGAGEVVNALGGLASGLINFFSGKEDPIDRLKRFGQLSEPLSLAGDALNKFSSAFKGAIDLLNSSTLSPEVLKTMDQIKGMLGTDMGGMFGGSPKIIGQVSGLADSIAKLADSASKLQSNTSANTTAPTAGGISTDILNKRTMQHYDDVRSANDSMINLLQGLNEKLDQLDRTTRDSSNTLSRSISKASPNLM